jgi:bacillithiol system protein YtxJ
MSIFSLFNSKDKVSFPWIELTTSEQLISAIENSVEKPVLFFKHSTRCSISSMAKTRFENNWNIENKSIDIYYLDLIAFRDLSNKIAELTGVEHQSPQAIVLKNKQVIYQASHTSIDAHSIENLITSN